jgi:hypothetical protein
MGHGGRMASQRFRSAKANGKPPSRATSRLRIMPNCDWMPLRIYEQDGMRMPGEVFNANRQLRERAFA